MEQSALTKDQVERAERREGIYHPVITLLESYTPRFLQLNQEYSRLTGNQEQHDYIQKNYGFLADALEATEDFTLKPLELIAIWSKACEVLGLYQRYRLAGMLSSAYGIKGIKKPNWKGFPRYTLENFDLPKKVLNDREGLIYVKSRFREITASLDEICFYAFGIGWASNKLGELFKREIDGDKKATEELDALIQYEKEHNTLLLGNIYENFGNGMTTIFFKINDALEKSK